MAEIDPYGADITNAVRLGQLSPEKAATMATGKSNPMMSGQTSNKEMQMMNDMMMPSNSRKSDLEQGAYRTYIETMGRLRQAESEGAGALKNLQPPITDLESFFRNFRQKAGE